MLSVLEKQKLATRVESDFDDILYEIENDRHYPSVREAGTAPTDAALESSRAIFGKLLDDLLAIGVKYEDIFCVTTIEDIIKDINSNQEKNIAESIHGLTEVDSFVRDNGERKYRYVNTVYKHTPSNKFICVEEQRGVGEWEDMVSSVSATEVEKKEIVRYEWS